MSLERLLDRTTDAPDTAEKLYNQLHFPEAASERPYVYINMVSTADGKIVLGEPGGAAAGLGSSTDQLLFRRLQQLCDAALLGATTLRAGTVIYPPEKPRFVLTRHGDLPFQNRFFTDAPDRAWVIAPEDLDPAARTQIEANARLLTAGCGSVNLPLALRRIRQELGIRVLLCEGGASLNELLIRQGLVDELFLTLSNKLKGGARLPTPVGGEGFPSGLYLPLELLSIYQDEGELYLRYRLGSEPVKAGK